MAAITASLLSDEAARVAAAEQRVDIAVVMDATASMGEHLATAKTTVLQLWEELRAASPRSTFRLGFVAYRDYLHPDAAGRPVESSDGFARITTVPLTADFSAVLTAIRGISAHTGVSFDWPEDLTGGLHAVSQFDWSGTTRMIVHVADAPCHGVSISGVEPGEDVYPAGDPAGLDPLAIMADFARRDIEYRFIRCDKSVDTMLRAFGAAYNAAMTDASRGIFAVDDLQKQIAAAAALSASIRSAASTAAGGGGGGGADPSGVPSKTGGAGAAAAAPLSSAPVTAAGLTPSIMSLTATIRRPPAGSTPAHMPAPVAAAAAAPTGGAASAPTAIAAPTAAAAAPAADMSWLTMSIGSSITRSIARNAAPARAPAPAPAPEPAAAPAAAAPEPAAAPAPGSGV